MAIQIQKKVVSLKASLKTLRQLEELKKEWRDNRSQIIITCIDRIWWSEIGSKNQENEDGIDN